MVLGDVTDRKVPVRVPGGSPCGSRRIGGNRRQER
jgi:hypothetical protein